MSPSRLPPASPPPPGKTGGRSRFLRLRLSPGQAVFLTLALLASLGIVAIRYLPWWVLLAIALGGLGLIRFGVPYLLKQLLLLPFRVKGQALAGASIQIHSLHRAPFPSADDSKQAYWDAQDLARYQQMDWYFLDVSILPGLNRQENARIWEPAQLRLLPASVRGHSLESLDCQDVTLHNYRIFGHELGHDFTQDTVGKYDGARRLLLHLGVKPGIKRLVFRYYLERFGEVDLAGDRGNKANPQPRS